ncbi:MAG: hypothetical protein CMO55_10810 [Verrucomicrobiales bacterium]|nr:hypothetical protein [Verrucomicrobiales bacterium]
MKTETFLLLIGFLYLAEIPHASAQDTSELEEAGRAALEDPRFKNMLRTIRENPEDAASAVPDEHADSVKSATDMFLKNKEKLKLDDDAISPEMKEDFEKKARGAVSAVGQMIDKSKSSDDPPATRAVPATREATVAATPIAMPVSPEESSAEPEPTPETVVQRDSVRPSPDASPIPSQIPDSPGLTPDQIPEPRPLEKQYDMEGKGGLRPKKSKKREMEIFARESIMDNESNQLTFEGNVVLNHPQYDMKCEKLVIHMAGGAMMPAGGGGGGGATFSRAVATGGTVEIRSTGPEGETRLALARKADYDAAGEIITLSGGPPYLQDGDRFIETNSNDAKIVMRINGKCEILGSERSRIVIPVEKPKQGESMGINGALGNLSNREKPKKNR